MIDIRLPYIHEDVDRYGNVRVYFKRRGGRKVRIRVPIGSPEFMVTYHVLKTEGVSEQTAKGPQRAIPGTIRWLTTQYYAAATFKRLDSRTHYVRRGILDYCC